MALGVESREPANGSMLSHMKIATGKVIGGKVVVEGVSLPEGASVTVLAKDDSAGFALTPEQETELLESIAEAERGETVGADEVLRNIGRRGG